VQNPIDYQNFKILAQNKDLGKLDYYQNIVKFKDDILYDVANRGQSVVAAELNIPQPKLSTIVNVLKVL